ncbi:hypothetical protein ScalyP_jg10273 [Parmales sp. scaly parma]|nr:hypothetical protein ScalyP_jg10273 [Parmales sp. scaly parma]
MKVVSILSAAAFVLSSVESFSPRSLFTSTKSLMLQANALNTVSDLASLKTLAKQLNPVVGYFDPLKLAEAEFWPNGDVLAEQSLFTPQQGVSVNERTISWLRHAEIKHGRIAMFAFVGWCVQSNFHVPWSITLDGSNPSFAAGLSPPEQWDALPEFAKYQIITVIGFLEFWGEGGGNSFDCDLKTPHYTLKEGLPGQYPPFHAFSETVHPVPFNLYDPFNFSAKMSEEKAAKGLRAEINNGRLAMIGIFGFVAESKLAGSVPLLDGLVKHYDGNFMAPFMHGIY